MANEPRWETIVLSDAQRKTTSISAEVVLHLERLLKGSLSKEPIGRKEATEVARTLLEMVVREDNPAERA